VVRETRTTAWKGLSVIESPFVYIE